MARLGEIKEKINGKIPSKAKSWGKTIFKPFRLLYVSYGKFMQDDCLTKSSAIAYTAIMSLIPALAVALSVYSIFAGGTSRKDDLFREVSLFMTEHNIRINIDPIFNAISSLVENAGKVGGIGAVVMVFSATAMLRAMEESLNSIFRAKATRSMVTRIVYYWAALTLSPILLIAGTTAANQVTEIFSSPSYNVIVRHNNSLVIAGSRATVRIAEKPGSDFLPLDLSAMEFSRQSQYRFDDKGKAELVTSDPIDPLEIKKIRFSGMVTSRNRMFAVSDRGIILAGRPDTNRWSLLKYESSPMHKIAVNGREQLFIASGNGSILASTPESRVLGRREIADGSIIFKDIAFVKNLGIAVGTRGTVAISRDDGKTWDVTTPEEAIIAGKLVSLNAVSILADGNILIAGENGAIILSNDDGRNWESLNFEKTNYHAALLINARTAFIGGERGKVIFTRNRGKGWNQVRLSTPAVTALFADGGKIWAAGKNGLIQNRELAGTAWQGEKGSNNGAVILNFLAPFVFIWLLFLVIYVSMPSTRVPLPQAALGAAFTGTVWVVFILLFIVYVRAFADSTFAVYGVLAAIPLFLLMIYSSVVIFLLGAEVTCVAMSPARYLKNGAETVRACLLPVHAGLSVTMAVYRRFETGEGGTTAVQLARITGVDAGEISRVVTLLEEQGILGHDAGGNIIPARSSVTVLSTDLMEILVNGLFAVPENAGPINNGRYEEKLFNAMKNAAFATLNEKYLADMIKSAQGKEATRRYNQK